MAEIAIAVASCVVTELIKSVINRAQAAVRCTSECRKLQEELVLIKPDVERIEKRLATLRTHHCDAQEDLQMVDEWLERLKKAIDSANTDVYKCNSGRFSLDQYTLSKRLTSKYNTITKLAQQRQSLFLQLRNLMAPPHGMLHPPQNWHESPGTSVLRRMADERNDVLHRADLHRQSMSAPSSVHNGHGYGGYSEESSGHGGYSEESSGHGGDSPGAALLRQMTQQRDLILQRADRHRQAEADQRQQLARRHTLASSHGNDHAYDKWKY